MTDSQASANDHFVKNKYIGDRTLYRDFTNEVMTVIRGTEGHGKLALRYLTTPFPLHTETGEIIFTPEFIIVDPPAMMAANAGTPEERKENYTRIRYAEIRNEKIQKIKTRCYSILSERVITTIVQTWGDIGCQNEPNLCWRNLKKVWGPVSANRLTFKERKSIIRSSIFLKAKFLLIGVFDKLKARLVAVGNMQDRSVYNEGDTSSPTAGMSSIYMAVAIAAGKGRHVTTVDIEGAYLNAKLEKDVYMRLDPKLAEAIAALDPIYAPFIEPNGTVVVRLHRALYGCIESSKLWFEHISKSLARLGYTF